MPIRYFLLIAAALLLGTPLAAQQKKKPVETSKPAASKPKPAPAPAKEPEAYAWLLVSTDLEVNISVNFGKNYRVSPQDEGRRIPLEQGANVVKITPTDGGKDGEEKEINVINKGNQRLILDLKARRDAKAAELEQEKRKAEDTRLAEQRRQEEEARKTEETRLAEQKQKEEEAQFPPMITEPRAGSFIRVKGGAYLMGCSSKPSECEFDEKPTHQVTLGDFYIGETEVTQAQWRAVMGNNPSHFSGCDQCPVEKVSWEDIQEFLSRLNSGGTRYRLPTEAEWEYAARGGNLSWGYQYSGSNELNDVAWFSFNSGQMTHPVKGKKANELGLYDMSGNVWEWCSDWYGNYDGGRQTNPTGPVSGSSRVIRGGAWVMDPVICRVANRYDKMPAFRDSYIGFRLARNP